MGAVKSFASALDPTTSSGLVNLATGGLGATPELFGKESVGSRATAGLAQFEDFAREGLGGLLGGGGGGGGVGELGRREVEPLPARQDPLLSEQRFGQLVEPGLALGQQAGQQLGAFSGALGPGAQAAAFKGFQESPGTQFLREQGTRGINTQSAVTGAGGGNRLAALTEFSQGLALQDLARQQQQLQGLSQQGLGFAGIGQGLTGISEQAISGEQQRALQRELGFEQFNVQREVSQQQAEAAAAAQESAGRGNVLSGLLGLGGAGLGLAFGGPVGGLVGSQVGGGLGSGTDFSVGPGF